MIRSKRRKEHPLHASCGIRLMYADQRWADGVRRVNTTDSANTPSSFLTWITVYTLPPPTYLLAPVHCLFLQATII